MLKNTAYPNDWPSEGVAHLVDGVYREKYMPDSATEMVISLADIHTFGDLNGDRVDDVLVILISYPGGSGTFFYLAAVLNQDGTPKPVATAFLGDRTIIRSMTIESGQIALEMITPRARRSDVLPEHGQASGICAARRQPRCGGAG
jgi:hypothetical protein